MYEFDLYLRRWTISSCTGGPHSLKRMQAVLVENTIFVLGSDGSEDVSGPVKTLFALDLSRYVWVEIAKFSPMHPRRLTNVPIIGPFDNTICIFRGGDYYVYGKDAVCFGSDVIWFLDKRKVDELLGRNLPDSTHA
jgi:hypothetical protein